MLTKTFLCQAAWIRVPHLIREDLEAEGLSLREGIHAASHALLNIMPLYVRHLKLCSTSFEPSPVKSSFLYPELPVLAYDLFFCWTSSFSLISLIASTNGFFVESSELEGDIDDCSPFFVRYIMCNPQDLGCDCANPNDTRYYPERLLLFDKHPGGIGIAAQVNTPLLWSSESSPCQRWFLLLWFASPPDLLWFFDVQVRPMFAELLQSALELLVACECTANTGCPACIQVIILVLLFIYTTLASMISIPNL
jgi:hypothetical protein